MNRRGQIAQTMTWTVATFIVIILSFIFVFVTGSLAAKKGVLGLDIDYISNEDSGVGTQQMLFAILEKNVGGGKISNLIASGDLSSVSIGVKGILADFESKGVKCNFIIDGKVNLGSGSGKVVSMNLHNEVIKLRC